jgi:hypothetical protein
MGKKKDKLKKILKNTGKCLAAVGAVAGAIVAVESAKSEKDSKEADAKIKKWKADHLDEENARQWTETYSKTKTSDIDYL